MPCYKDNITRNLENTRSINMNEITKSQSLNNMRTPPRKVSLMWIGLPITFGVILCITIISLYFFKFGEYGLSDNPSEWSSFGSLLSGAFSLLSAIGTIGTLMFIILQHQQVTKAQEEISRKQMEILEFEKYEKHKSSFYEVLEHIEKFSGSKYYFTSKFITYKRLFPNNSPLSTQYYLSSDFDIKSYAKHFNNFIKTSRKGFCTADDIECLTDLIYRTSSNINRENHQYLNGDVHYQKHAPILNIFQIREFLDFTYSLLKDISNFANHNLEIASPHAEKFDTTKVSLSMIDELKNSTLSISFDNEVKNILTICEIACRKDNIKDVDEIRKAIEIKNALFSTNHCEWNIEHNKKLIVHCREVHLKISVKIDEDTELKSKFTDEELTKLNIK